MAFCIYLSGKIRKSHEEDNGLCWGNVELDQLTQTFSPTQVEYLDPSIRNDDLSDDIAVFGRDLLQVYLSNLVLADVREKRGIGVGGEMIFAGWIGVPVISIAEECSFYRPKNAQILHQYIPSWTHPFVSGPSIYVADTVLDAVKWAKKHLLSYKEKPLPKNVSTIPPIFLSPMQQYIERQLEKDLPMKQLVTKNADLAEKIEEIRKKSIT